MLDNPTFQNQTRPNPTESLARVQAMQLQALSNLWSSALMEMDSLRQRLEIAEGKLAERTAAE